MNSRIILFLSSSLLFLLTLLKILNSPYFLWNNIRLTASAALVRGLPVFSLMETGQIVSGVTGPVQAFAYAPAALVSSPVTAVYLGCLLTLLFTFGPPLLFFKRQRLCLLYFLAFCCLVFNSRPLDLSAFIIHADAVSLGLASLACIMLITEKNLTPRQIFFSQFFAVLCVLSKPSFLPVAPVVFLLSVILSEKKKKSPHALVSIAGAAVAFGIVVCLCGWDFIAYAGSTTAHSHWKLGSFFKAFFYASNQLLKEIWPLLLAILFLYTSTAENIFSGILKKPSTVFLTVGLSLIPPSIMGLARIGGDINTFSPCIYFLLLTLICLVRERGLKQIALVGVAFFSFLLLPKVYELTRVFTDSGFPNYLAEAYQYAENNPRRPIYFAEFPLINAMKYHKLYPSVYAAIEASSFEGKYALTEEKYQNQIADAEELVFFYVKGAWKLFPFLATGKKWEVTTDPRLRDWLIYRKPGKA